MLQYLLDDHGVFDTSNHLRATTASPAGLNGLSRLLDTPPPATLTQPPALVLTEEPLANTEHYDDLRGMSHVS